MLDRWERDDSPGRGQSSGRDMLGATRRAQSAVPLIAGSASTRRPDTGLCLSSSVSAAGAPHSVLERCGPRAESVARAVAALSRVIRIKASMDIGHSLVGEQGKTTGSVEKVEGFDRFKGGFFQEKVEGVDRFKGGFFQGQPRRTASKFLERKKQ